MGSLCVFLLIPRNVFLKALVFYSRLCPSFAVRLARPRPAPPRPAPDLSPGVV